MASQGSAEANHQGNYLQGAPTTPARPNPPTDDKVETRQSCQCSGSSHTLASEQQSTTKTCPSPAPSSGTGRDIVFLPEKGNHNQEPVSAPGATLTDRNPADLSPALLRWLAERPRDSVRTGEEPWSVYSSLEGSNNA